jgi:hypothetical protein
MVRPGLTAGSLIPELRTFSRFVRLGSKEKEPPSNQRLFLFYGCVLALGVGAGIIGASVGGGMHGGVMISTFG